jgi:hypothetical protein
MKTSKIITNIIFDEIIVELKSAGYEADHWFEQRNCVFIEANKSTHEHNFELFVRYDHVTSLINADVFCLSPVQEEKIVFCLKLLNYCAVAEDETKYNLCPIRHLMVCKTYHSIYTCVIPIGEALTNQLDCSIDNLEHIYWAIKNYDLKYLLGDIHPVKFHNYIFD